MVALILDYDGSEVSLLSSVEQIKMRNVFAPQTRHFKIRVLILSTDQASQVEVVPV